MALQSTLPARVETVDGSAVASVVVLQSTLPARVETSFRNCLEHLALASIHSTCKGRDSILLSSCMPNLGLQSTLPARVETAIVHKLTYF